MGYCASGGGTILLQKENVAGYKAVAESLHINPGEKGKVLDAIYERILYDFESYGRDFEVDGNHLCVGVSHEYDKYHDEDINDLFVLLMPILAAGTEIDFVGEDDCNWCFRSVSDGSYEEVNGFVVYDGPACDSETCAYAHKGECRFHAVFGEFPKLGPEYASGCSGYIFKGGV